jgi:predicted nucleic acid-binding protein
MHEPGILSDASSVIYLAKADALRDAAALVGALLVPPAVWREAVEAGERRGQLDQARIRLARDQGLLHFVELDPAIEKMAIEIKRRRRIGLGESQVLAVARKGGLVLMDDRRAARVATSMGISPVRTISLPVLCWRRGLIDSSGALDLLRRLTRVVGVRADLLMRLEADVLEGER